MAKVKKLKGNWVCPVLRDKGQFVPWLVAAVQITVGDINNLFEMVLKLAIVSFIVVFNSYLILIEYSRTHHTYYCNLTVHHFLFVCFCQTAVIIVLLKLFIEQWMSIYMTWMNKVLVKSRVWCWFLSPASSTSKHRLWELFIIFSRHNYNSYVVNHHYWSEQRLIISPNC